jgi:hypothetical protein
MFGRDRDYDDEGGGFAKWLGALAIAVVGGIGMYSCGSKVPPAPGVVDTAESYDTAVANCEAMYGHAVADGVGTGVRTMVRHSVYASRRSTGSRARVSVVAGAMTGAFEAGRKESCMTAAATRFGVGQPAAAPVISEPAIAGPAAPGPQPARRYAFNPPAAAVPPASQPVRQAAPASANTPSAAPAARCIKLAGSDGKPVKVCSGFSAS